MCPVCFATTLALAAGVGTGGGVGVALLRRMQKRSVASRAHKAKQSTTLCVHTLRAEAGSDSQRVCAPLKDSG
jgi:hypothetical protein